MYPTLIHQIKSNINNFRLIMVEKQREFLSVPFSLNNHSLVTLGRVGKPFGIRERALLR